MTCGRDADADGRIFSMSTVRNLDACIGANNCSTANYSSNAKNSSTADAASTTNNSSSQTSQSTTDKSSSQGFQDSEPGSFVATSDCSSLSSPYVPSLTSMALTSSNVSFNIKCDTDYSDPDADFLTVAVFTFEDCIAACASFNEVRFYNPPKHYRAGTTRQSRASKALFYSKNRVSKLRLFP